ncbi:Uma2 family endonuclease [Microseira sp. BLCC-F43]|jgi:Uma2 family endonuclease|uniref:Uma2 family endonuclease n=1 Tax=Microseira sp. BLCC-F43 TaxID=3153602 RepID=UPI0035BAD1B9
MIATPETPQKMTVDEYLEWEARQEIRHEYVNGEIFAMTGGSIPHNDITLNLYRALRHHLRPRGYRINVSDVKLQLSSSSAYFYPDVIVSCDPQDLNSRKFIQYPKLIVEVLSPSTEAKDRGKKFTYCRTIPTLQEYVLIESEKIAVDCYRRGEGKMWLYYPYTAGDIISLDSIELLYEGVIFEGEE